MPFLRIRRDSPCALAGGILALPLTDHLVVDGIRADFELPEQPMPLAFDAFTVPFHYFSAGNKIERLPAL